MSNTAFAKLIGKKASVKQAASKKSDAPAIVLSDEHSDSLDELIKAKAEVKAATAALKQAEASLLQLAVERQDADGIDGNYSGTYELIGKNNTSKFISSDRFSVSQDSEVHDAIVEIVGENSFEQMIEQEHTVQLRKDVFLNQDKQDLLVELIGDKFDELFETTIKFTAKKGLKENIYGLVNNDVDKLEDVRALLPQYKSAIK
jgi:hypothetical protein